MRIQQDRRMVKKKKPVDKTKGLRDLEGIFDRLDVLSVETSSFCNQLYRHSQFIYLRPRVNVSLK